MVSSIRIELDDTALVRPSNAASLRKSGSAGSTTIAETPLLSSAAASARPTSPPPKMIASARSILAPIGSVRLTGESTWEILAAGNHLGVGHGNGCSARTQARPCARLARRAECLVEALCGAQLGR